ncbi:FBN1 [Branchiostoma lanceolatum]|uniref:FBN1 protein n=1 Tax=Branchiostoma lanceolatum TaxID=7740 RepID=A0A8J9ZUT2_BRALA|nr:FBN1 [Branchiostoma lanceolatum]
MSRFSPPANHDSNPRRMVDPKVNSRGLRHTLVTHDGDFSTSGHERLRRGIFSRDFWSKLFRGRSSAVLDNVSPQNTSSSNGADWDYFWDAPNSKPVDEDPTVESFLGDLGEVAAAEDVDQSSDIGPTEDANGTTEDDFPVPDDQEIPGRNDEPDTGRSVLDVLNLKQWVKEVLQLPRDFPVEISLVSPNRYRHRQITYSLTEPFGTFSSPGYPLPYTLGSNYTWNINVTKGKVIKLRFYDFAVGSSKAGCQENSKDYVVVTANSVSNERWVLCGKDPVPITTRGNTAMVQLVSSLGQDSFDDMGFFAAYVESPIPSPSDITTGKEIVPVVEQERMSSTSRMTTLDPPAEQERTSSTSRMTTLDPPAEQEQASSTSPITTQTPFRREVRLLGINNGQVVASTPSMNALSTVPTTGTAPTVSSEVPATGSTLSGSSDAATGSSLIGSSAIPITDPSLNGPSAVPTTDPPLIVSSAVPTTDPPLNGSSAVLATDPPLDGSSAVLATDPAPNDSPDAITDPELNGSSVPVTDPTPNGSSDAATGPDLTDSLDAVTDPSLNGSSDAVPDPILNGSSDAVTDPAFNGSSDAAIDQSLNGSSDAVTDPPLNGAVTDPALNGSADAVTDPSLNVSSDAVTYQSLNRSSGAVTDPALNGSADAVTDPSLNVSSDAVTYQSLNRSSGAVTDPALNGSADAVTDPSLNVSSDAVTYQSLNRSSGAVTDPALNGSADAVTDPSLNVSSDAVTYQSLNRSSDAVTDPPLNGSSDAVIHQSLNGSSGAVTDPALNGSAIPSSTPAVPATGYSQTGLPPNSSLENTSSQAMPTTFAETSIVIYTQTSSETNSSVGGGFPGEVKGLDTNDSNGRVTSSTPMVGDTGTHASMPAATVTVDLIPTGQNTKYAPGGFLLYTLMFDLALSDPEAVFGDVKVRDVMTGSILAVMERGLKNSWGEDYSDLHGLRLIRKGCDVTLETAVAMQSSSTVSEKAIEDTIGSAMQTRQWNTTAASAFSFNPASVRSSGDTDDTDWRQVTLIVSPIAVVLLLLVVLLVVCITRRRNYHYKEAYTMGGRMTPGSYFNQSSQARSRKEWMASQRERDAEGTTAFTRV